MTASVATHRPVELSRRAVFWGIPTPSCLRLARRGKVCDQDATGRVWAAARSRRSSRRGFMPRVIHVRGCPAEDFFLDRCDRSGVDAGHEEMGFLSAHCGNRPVCLGAGRGGATGQLLP